MNAKTYESVQGIGKTAQELETFGTAQNQLNADILKELRIMQLQTNMLTHHLKEAQEEIAKLKEEQVKYILQLKQYPLKNRCFLKFGHLLVTQDCIYI